jgi:hypothetical protein
MRIPPTVKRTRTKRRLFKVFTFLKHVIFEYEMNVN